MRIQYGPHLFPEGPVYYIRTKEQSIKAVLDSHDEIMRTISQALELNFDKFSLSEDLEPLNFEVSFMNYGDTELVYLLKINDDKKQILLINQPHKSKKIVKNQYSNLKHFYEQDPRFVINSDFLFESKNYVVHLASYEPNALCVGNLRPEFLGIWNPRPYYHFEEFNQETSEMVNISRIAHLVNLYDNKNNLGVSKTEISGNDFMLAQDVDLSSLDSIINKTRIIAIRDTIKMGFEKYLDLIKKEFQFSTYRDDEAVLSGDFRINSHSKMSIPLDVINQGIIYGIKLKEHN